MKCIKCGHINNDNDIYCSICGNVLSDNSNNDISNNNINKSVNISEILTSNNKKYDSIKNNLVDERLLNNNSEEYHQEEFVPDRKMNIFNFLIKPTTEIKYADTNSSKSNIILLIITIISLTIGNLINNMINIVWENKYNIWSGEITKEFNIKNLSNLNYVDLLLKDLFIYAGILLGIIIIYYFASLIVNKRIGFKKISSIICYSLYPFIIGIFIITPLLSLLFSDFKLILTIIFTVYTLSILTININRELDIKDNIKLYLNTVCLSLVILGSYYIYFKFISTLSRLF